MAEQKARRVMPGGAGVGIMSGFGIPDNPPDYNPDKNKKMVVPIEDTHPGTGLNHLTGKVDEPDARSLLGEDD